MNLRNPDGRAAARALLLGTALLLTVPLPWVTAALLAAGFHELCHVGMICVLGGHVRQFRADTRGAVLEMVPMGSSRELLAAAAGPAGSLLLVLTARKLPRLAVCGLIQGCFNLLPVYPMDGGRILRCILRYFLREEWVQRAARAAEYGVIAGILLTGVFLFFRYNQKPGVFLPVFLLMIRIIQGKIPCKPGLHNVQ